ncbi:MAG: hypothetical protein ACYC7L_01205 [Nitrospirota bacterium]
MIQKIGNTVVALFFICAALIPLGHSDAREVLYIEFASRSFAATAGPVERHGHNVDFHRHDSDSDTEDSYHIHLLLEGNSSSGIRLDREKRKTAQNAFIVEPCFSDDARLVVNRSIYFPDSVLFTQVQAVPTGHSPPC